MKYRTVSACTSVFRCGSSGSSLGSSVQKSRCLFTSARGGVLGSCRPDGMQFPLWLLSLRISKYLTYMSELLLTPKRLIKEQIKKSCRSCTQVSVQSSAVCFLPTHSMSEQVERLWFYSSLPHHHFHLWLRVDWLLLLTSRWRQVTFSFEVLGKGSTALSNFMWGPQVSKIIKVFTLFA